MRENVLLRQGTWRRIVLWSDRWEMEKCKFKHALLLRLTFAIFAREIVMEMYYGETIVCGIDDVDGCDFALVFEACGGE